MERITGKKLFSELRLYIEDDGSYIRANKLQCLRGVTVYKAVLREIAARDKEIKRLHKLLTVYSIPREWVD